MGLADETFPEKVLETTEVAPGVFLLTVSRTVDFTPGQVVAVTLDPAIPPRMYSIASGRGDPGLDLLFDVVQGGALTPRLARVRPGDEVLVSAPFGTFVDGEGPSAWIAAGTGVAPFRSMVRSGLTAGKTLVHGNRRLSGLFFREHFREALGDRYVPCCSSEKEEGIFPGRVTAWLDYAPSAAGMRYLLCGSAEMVVDVRDALIGRGVPYAQVGAEIYF